MYLRISLTDRCNLRCRYCLPAHPRFAPDSATADELMRLTGFLVEEAGIYKIRYTGGEPALCPELVDHIRHGAGLVDGEVGLTSTGVLLADLLPDLQAAGLRRLNISLDAADAAGFRAITRRDHFPAVLRSIRRAKALGFAPLKVNAVALPTTDVVGLTELACAEGVHLRFIELMAVGEARDLRRAGYRPATAIRQDLFDAGWSMDADPELDDPTSRVWTIAGVDPRRTTVGFITTTSDPFCATCDRLRLTSRGRLHNCLFDQRGVDLLGPLRGGDHAELRDRIRRHVAAKAPPERFIQEHDMAAIGERSGQLPEALGRVAALYRRQAEKIERVFWDTALPLVVVGIGAIVLLADVALFKTLVRMAESILDTL